MNKKRLVFGERDGVFYIGESTEVFPDNRTEQEKEEDEIVDEVNNLWQILLDGINEKYKDKYYIYACSCCCGGESIDVRVDKVKKKESNEES